MTDIMLTPGEVSLADWRRIWQGAAAKLDPACHDTIRESAASVARILSRGAPVYGINTGFGKLATVRIPNDQLETLQRNIVLSHAAGVGDPAPAHIVRLMMALKMASLARGASGVQLKTVQLMEDMLAHDLLPVIPEQGSVGASGDLAPLSHMACALIGVGDVFLAGVRMPAETAFAKANLAPLTSFAAKEGLALLNGTQFSTACALAGLFGAERLLQVSLVAGALSTEAVKGSDNPFDPRIHALRGHAGQKECARALRELMAGSAIRASHLEDDTRVQDPYCVRCQPQVAGAALGLLRQAAETLLTEANGVSDNPLIFPETDEALSGGNFHAEPVAFAADMIAMAVCELGSISERRTAMLVDPALSDLPAFLTPSPGLNSGFMIPQVTAAALVSENKQMAFPASVDSIPSSANREDHVSMGMTSANKAGAVVTNVGLVLGIELLTACQALEFHQPLRAGKGVQAAYDIVRQDIEPLDHDRALSHDMERMDAMLRRGIIRRAAEEACGLTSRV